MSVIIRRSFYAVKLMVSGYSIFAILLAIIISMVTVNLEEWGFAEASIPALLVIFTVVMPTFTIVISANAFAEELEEMTLSLLWTYAVSKWLLMLERLFLILLLLVLYFTITLRAIHLWCMELTVEGISNILTAALPVHLFFVGITLMFSLIGRNMVVGLGVGAGYWLIEIITRGNWTQHMFIFQPVWPLEHVNSKLQGWWITAAGLMFIVAALLLFIYGRLWLIKKK